MKYSILPLLLLAVLVSGCAKHYSKQNGDSVSFYFKVRDADKVYFASSHLNYSFVAAREIKNNMWKVSVPTVRDFKYFYIVDGAITLPDCQYSEIDDFGSRNCLYMADM